jgi:methylmalonyl-CoA/ethylmalonyl-CoA epimerase
VELLGIHHVAFAHVAGADVDAVLQSVLGLEVSVIESGPGLTERILPVGEGSIHTLEAAGPGIIERFTAKRGNGLHHVAFEVADIAEAVRELLERGIEMVDVEPRPGGDETLVAFIHPKATAGLLVELVQVLT